MGRLAARAKNQIEVRTDSKIVKDYGVGGYSTGKHWGTAHKLNDDPRPDLTDDTHLWVEFLRIASSFHPSEPEKNASFTVILNYMRCGGTVLIAGAAGWLLRPLIDEARGWESQEAYDAEKKALMPWGDWIKMTLRQLSDKYPVGGGGGGRS